MKCIFIINPSAGRQNFRENLKDIIANLVLGNICNTVDVYYTEKQYDARDKVASLQKGEYDFLVSVGGDGTLNEVINGMVIGGSEIPVAILSTGTVNDFSTYLKLPQETAEFCEMVEAFYLKKVDVGKVNGHYFINVVASGMFSDVGFKVAKDKKAAMGKLAYYLEGAADFPKQISTPFRMRFTMRDWVLEEDVLLFMVSNTQSVGGFREIAPLASSSDGIFDLIIIKSMDIFQMVPLAFSIFQGDHVNHPAVEYIQTDKLMIENLSGEPLNVDFDGEQLMSGFPLDISMIKGGVTILVPSPAKIAQE